MVEGWKWAIIAISIATAGVAFGQQSTPMKEVAAESYEVYSSVLSEHYGSWFKEKDPPLISSYTALEPQGHPGVGANCRERAKDVQVLQDLLGQLVSEKEKFQISSKLRLPGKYQMVKGKSHIRENQEPGIVFLSNVEFSPDRSKAIVLVGHSCGPLCGDGFVWILDKHGDHWSLAKDQLHCGWIR
jgi:hypothetical protein